MPSPFPGMDPFIEQSVWGDFHSRFNPIIADALNPVLRPRYVTRVQHRVVLERDDGTPQDRYPDVGVFEADAWAGDVGGGGGLALAVEPRTVTLPQPDEFRQTFVEIRGLSDGRLVTVIELMSPSNKRPRGSDRGAFLAKRRETLRADASFVEIDLLRGGRPLPPADARPPHTYAALVVRPWDAPQADLFEWPLLSPLPTLPVPLAEGEAPVLLDLQAAFATLYERAAYDTLDYAAELQPPLPDDARKRVMSR